MLLNNFFLDNNLKEELCEWKSYLTKKNNAICENMKQDSWIPEYEKLSWYDKYCKYIAIVTILNKYNQEIQNSGEKPIDVNDLKNFNFIYQKYFLWFFDETQIETIDLKAVEDEISRNLNYVLNLLK